MKLLNLEEQWEAHKRPSRLIGNTIREVAQEIMGKRFIKLGEYNGK